MRLKDKTTTYVIHGMVSVLILISGLFGAVKWFEDEKRGLYSSFNSIEKVVIGFISILAPALLMALSGLAAIYLSNSYTIMSVEIVAIGLYVLLVSGFSYVLKLLVRSGTDICAILPVLIIGSLIFCPVFIDASKFINFIYYINKLFPSFYYLKVISNGMSGIAIMSGITLVLISSGMLINYSGQK